jgi:hypothetical protein
VFTAHAGDAIVWRKDGGDWSAPLSISGVGFVIADAANAGPTFGNDTQLPNIDVLASGVFTGTEDALYIVEVLADGVSFRWRLAPPLPGLAASEASTAGVAVDNSAAEWSAAVTIADGVPIELSQGVFVQFAVAPSGVTSPRAWPHGDTYYIPVTTGATTPLAEGVSVTWSAPSGFTANDTWAFTARAALAARGPHEGDTAVTLRGAGFLPSSALLCRFTDQYAQAPVAVPAVYVSPTEVRCITPPRDQDGIAPAVPSRPDAPAIALAGAYTGPRSASFVLAVIAGDNMTLDMVVEGAAPSPITLGVVAELADGVWWHELPGADGILARFDATGADGGAHQTGDVYTFSAAALVSAALSDGDAHPELAPGSIKPGVLTSLAVSNDGGVAWSEANAAGMGYTRFFYSPVYVSPDGDDGGGDGTRAAPYRTLARAVAAALSAPAPGPRGAPAGLGAVTSWDSIILLPGRYTGPGNAGVAPGGRALLVSASARGGAVIDCAGAPGGDVVAGDKFAAPGPAGAGSLSLKGIATENCGTAYAGGVGALAAFPQGHWWTAN